MKLSPLTPKSSNRGQVSQVVTLAAPTGGWYVGANLAEAPAGTAYILDNAFPELDYVRSRGGAEAWATGMPNQAVASLMPWTNGVTFKLFACCGGNIYDVSSPGPVGAAQVTGLSTDYSEYAQFEGIGGSFLLTVNGIDPVQVYNGTTWNQVYNFTANTNSSASLTSVSSTANLVVGQSITGAGIPAATTILSISGSTITMSNAATATATGVLITAYQSAPVTGLTGNALSSIWVYKSRIYFTEANSLNVWYLGLNAIGGPATVFPLGAVFQFGGSLVVGGTWSMETSNGLVYLAVFITSEGEVAVFSGSYPGDTSWSVVGVYKIARPLGKRCLMKAGGDLAISTEDGIVPLSQVQTLDQVALQNIAVTKPIGPAWRDAVQARLGLTGWQLLLWPDRTMAVVNLPKINTTDRTQIISNARTGAWCRYLGWDANCFAVFEHNLFFGSSDGRVMQGEIGGSDDSNIYTMTVFPSYSHLGIEGQRKDIRLVRPMIQSNPGVLAQITIKVDFDLTIPNGPSSAAPPLPGTPLWDSAIWDTAMWPSVLTLQSDWLGAYGNGFVISPVLQVSFSGLTTPDVRLTTTDILFEAGNPFG